MNAAAFMGFLLLQPVNKCLSGPFDCLALKWLFRKPLLRRTFSGLNHTKSIMATNANAALIIRTLNECASPIS